MKINPKFKRGQVLMLHGKRELCFKVKEVLESDGEYYYRWNKNNAAAEHMVRALTPEEIGQSADERQP